ncbi:hypothetical protein B0H19DRAFT_1252999 [Mycena capillaripes]|nr:hypothetical protein B0H19DRAFT_1252999 [Mycena capillaripes]
MFSLSSFTILFALGVVSATPFESRQSTCSPNFEGAGVSIIAGGVEWAAPSFVAGTALQKDGPYPPNSTANWHVQQTGEYPPTYTVRAIDHNNLGVGTPNGELTLVNANPSDASQLWAITCAHCLPGASSSPHGGMFAAGCSIKSVNSTLCVEAEHGGDGFFLTGCNTVVAQTYDFWTAMGGSDSPPATSNPSDCSASSSKLVAGNLLASDASVSGVISDPSNQWRIILGLLAANLVLVFVLLVMGVLGYVRGKKADRSTSIPRYVPVKVRDDVQTGLYADN